MVVTTLSWSNLISTNSNHYFSSHNQPGLLIELNYYSKKSKVLVVVTVFKQKIKIAMSITEILIKLINFYGTWTTCSLSNVTGKLKVC